MGYFVRVLSTSSDPIPLRSLQTALEGKGLRATLVADGGETGWSQVVLSHSGGPEIAVLERDPVTEGELGAEDLAQFGDEVKRAKPKRAADWLLGYFDRVRCVYAFQVLRGADVKDGWAILDTIKWCVWESAPGILQADGERFTNEAGYHVLWQFDASVRGNWWMAVLEDGGWRNFRMDLGN